eukprot:NODE_523_length_6504_cov_0.524434.p2 type:complete len:132 gc:universal NODE_523_length_6504_cov_0.524434:1792-2187(+)
MKCLGKVLKKLKEFGLTLCARKCKFGMIKVNFLGFAVSSDGISPSQEKVSIIKNLRKPRTVTEVRPFLGLTSFYRCFIHKYATTSGPLNELTKKNTIFDWTTECDLAFEVLDEQSLTQLLWHIHSMGSLYI